MRHAARGARGALVLCDVPGLDQLARHAGIRVLGPYSYGMVLPSLGLNASIFSLTPPRGRLALVGQSPALARTIIDWAVPNSVGFSHIVGIGGNSDIGFGLVLDHLSRDPGTTAILLEIDRLRDPKLPSPPAPRQGCDRWWPSPLACGCATVRAIRAAHWRPPSPAPACC